MAGVDELREEFGKKRKELSTLRSKLSEVHSQKEEAFRQLRSLRDEAAKNMSQIREIQSQRDALTKEVSERKNERNKLNDTFKEKAAGRKDAERKNVQLRPGAGQKLPSLDQKHSKQDLNLNPSKLRAEIKRLEDLIETEVMSFEKEKELRKKVKGLKAAYQKVEQGKLAWKAVHAASADLAEARRKAQHSHHQVQELASLSQEKHEQVNALYKTVRELRKNENNLAEQYIQFKARHEELKKELQTIQSRVDELSKLFKEDDHRSFQEKIKEKTADVQEKIKKKQKLRIEDILAFQASKE